MSGYIGSVYYDNYILKKKNLNFEWKEDSRLNIAALSHATVTFYNIYFLKIRELFTNHDDKYTIHTKTHVETQL